MKEFLEFVVGELIDHPEETRAARGERRSGVALFPVLVLPRSEVGKVIGKQGHTIRGSSQPDGRGGATRHDKRVTLEIVERPEQAG